MHITVVNDEKISDRHTAHVEKVPGPTSWCQDLTAHSFKILKLNYLRISLIN